jgi:hypothetical protein
MVRMVKTVKTGRMTVVDLPWEVCSSGGIVKLLSMTTLRTVLLISTSLLPEWYGTNSLRSVTLKVHAPATHSFTSINPLASRPSRSSSHYVSSTPQ